MVKFEITGDKKLQSTLRTLGKQGPIVAMKGLKVTSLEILNNAKERLVQGGQRVTSKLFNSGKVVKSKTEMAYEVVFGGVEGELMYAYYVEFGRRAGKMPPIDYITEWVVKKGLADTYNIKTRKVTKRGKEFDYRAMSIAFLIARSIAKKGTKAHPFLYPAFEEKKENLLKNISNEVNKLIKELSIK